MTSADLEPVTDRPGRRGRSADGEIPRGWVYWSVAAGLGLALLILVLLETWPLSRHGHHMSVADAFNIAWKVALLPPGIVTARIAVDRINLSKREHQHAIEVARSSQLDAAQRRITELSAKASDQLGSDKAAVRIGGLTDLERLGQNNPDLRQTVADRICAYLQMPFPQALPPADEHGDGQEAGTGNAEPSPVLENDLAARQERQVRQTAQRILARHSRWPEDADEAPSSFWPGITVDLSEATLIDFAMHDCRLVEADFTGAIIHGTADFSGVKITGRLSFAEATITKSADFTGADVGGTVDFRRAVIGQEAAFVHARIRGQCVFGRATIGDVDFSSAELNQNVSFERAEIRGQVIFARARISGEADFRSATVAGITAFQGTEFGKHALFAGATLNGGADFTDSAIRGSTTFGEAKVGDRIYFREATITGLADFTKAILSSADFVNTSIGGRADFTAATFAGHVSVRPSTVFGSKGGESVQVPATANFAGAQMPDVVLGDGSQIGLITAEALTVDPESLQLTVKLALANNGAGDGW